MAIPCRAGDSALIRDGGRRPSRFRRAGDVAAYFGLTSRRWQSGTSIDRAASRKRATRTCGALYEAPSGLLTRFKGKDRVKSWGREIAKRSCHRKACVAVACKLTVVMHALWSDGTFYVGDAAAHRATARSARMPRPASFWVRIDERCGSSNAWRPQFDGRQLRQRKSAPADEDRRRPGTTERTLSCQRPRRSRDGRTRSIACGDAPSV